MNAIRVGTHCFGSREGYRTIARSADVTDAEDAELRGFGFGQSSDRGFLEGLEREPSAFGRPLAGGRLAITRIFAGDPDEAGRATLELRTILVCVPDIAPLMRAGLGAVLQLPGLWDRGPFRKGSLREIVMPEEAPPTIGSDRAAARAIFEAWSEAVLPERHRSGEELALRPSEQRGLVVVEPETAGSAAIAALASQLMPTDLAKLRWGLRLLSTSGPVDVCTLAPSARIDGRRMATRLRLDERGLAAGASPEEPLSLARVAAERSIEAAPPRGRRRWVVPAATIVGTALALALIAMATWWWAFRLVRGPDRTAAAAEVESSEAREAATASPREAPDETPSVAPATAVPEAPSREPAEADDAGANAGVGADQARGDESPEPIATPSEGAGTGSSVEDGLAPPSDAIPGAASGDFASPSSETPVPAPPAAVVDPIVAPVADPVGADDGPSSGSAPSVPETAGDSESDAAAAAAGPPDPCAACAALAERFVELGADADRANAFGDREALEAAASGFAESMRALGLDAIGADRRSEVFARLRGRPSSAAAMPAEWPRWRELLCRLEALRAALVQIDAVAARLAGRAAAQRQELMRLRKESAWIVGSDRATEQSLGEAIARLRDRLAEDCDQARPSRDDEAKVDAIRRWLRGDGESGRFDPPGGPPKASTTAPSAGGENDAP